MIRPSFESRPAWQRALMAIAAFLVIYQLSGALGRYAIPLVYPFIEKLSPSQLVQDLATPWVTSPVTVFSMILACWLLKALGIDAGWSWFVSRNRGGIVWGAAAAGIGALAIWMICLGAGANSVGRNPQFTWAGVPIYLQWVFFQSASEEIVARGLYLNLFREGFGDTWAVWIQALLFGFLHYLAYRDAPFLAGMRGPSFGLMVASTTVLGLLCGLAALRWGNLWAPITIHFVWNWVSSTLTGLPCSGSFPLPGPFLTKTIGNAQWLHGGLIGMEGSVLGLAALVAMTAWLAHGRENVSTHFLAEDPA